MEPVFPFPMAMPARGQGNLAIALRDQLRRAIVQGRLAVGAALPATREAARGLGIARNTVIAAYDLLIAEGYAEPRRNAKPVVADITARTGPRAPPRRRMPDELINPAWRGVQAEPAAAAAGAGTFRLGMPEHRHFAHQTWRRLCARALRQWEKEGFSYPRPEGIPALREAIAVHVAFARGVACTSADVIVTSGAQQAFDLLARMLVVPRKTMVALEDPGYAPLQTAFAAAGARIGRVPVDEEGLCVDRIPQSARIVCVTPSHQSPTGVVLSMARRKALLEFARRNGAVIIEDDYDGEFRYGGRPLDALQTLDRDGCVFYVGTFSKSLFPSLRKGFVVAPPWATPTLAAVKRCTDAHSDLLTQTVLAAFIRDGHLARHVRRMRLVYAQRRQVLLDALTGDLSEWFDALPSEAGLHLAARIRRSAIVPRIMEAARRHVPGAEPVAWRSAQGKVSHALAFGFGTIEADEIRRAMSRLGKALRLARDA